MTENVLHEFTSSQCCDWCGEHMLVLVGQEPIHCESRAKGLKLREEESKKYRAPECWEDNGEKP